MSGEMAVEDDAFWDELWSGQIMKRLKTHQWKELYKIVEKHFPDGPCQQALYAFFDIIRAAAEHGWTAKAWRKAFNSTKRRYACKDPDRFPYVVISVDGSTPPVLYGKRGNKHPVFLMRDADEESWDGETYDLRPVVADVTLYKYDATCAAPSEEQEVIRAARDVETQIRSRARRGWKNTLHLLHFFAGREESTDDEGGNRKGHVCLLVNGLIFDPAIDPAKFRQLDWYFQKARDVQGWDAFKHMKYVTTQSLDISRLVPAKKRRRSSRSAKPTARFVAGPARGRVPAAAAKRAAKSRKRKRGEDADSKQ